MTTRILVLCTGNSCRSQMAEGYIRHFGGERVDVFSAGIEAHGMNPRAVQTMREDGLDISGQRSKTIDVFTGQTFDHILTVCDSAQERCPIFPRNAQRVHFGFPDPARAQGTEEEIMEQFRRVRMMVRAYCEEFVRTVLAAEER